MIKADYAHELEVALSIATEAGKIMLHYFDNLPPQEIKSDGSPVTQVDKEINDGVIKRLTAVFPQDGIVGEEASTSDYGMGRKWLCDPIDGTKSYIWGVPSAMFSLALVVDGHPKVGVAYDPFLDRMYTAVSGGGSFCNGKRISVSNQQLSEGWVAFTGTVERVVHEAALVEAVKNTGAGLAVFDGGVYKCMLVARGRLPAYIGQGCGPYDVAAAEVIVTEAGGKMTDLKGSPLDYTKDFTGVLVTNGAATHAELVEVV